MRVTTTYADDFGHWYAEVEENNNGIGDIAKAEALAFDAIEAQIKARGQDDILRGVALTRRTSRAGTLTYYFEEEA